jgi:hypothetical protein
MTLSYDSIFHLKPNFKDSQQKSIKIGLEIVGRGYSILCEKRLLYCLKDDAPGDL